MKITRNADLSFIPASHENPDDPGVLKKILFTNKDLISGQIQMVNWAKLNVGKSFQYHYHQDMDEVFVIIAGSLEATINGLIYSLDKGDSILIEANEKHSMKNTGNTDVEYIVFGISRQENGKTIVC